MFVCLIEDGLLVKLPTHVAKGEVRARRCGSVWVKYVPRNAREAGRLAPILEAAARYVAEAA
jgi:hypothetical protein